MSENRIVVYTAIFGKYDGLIPQKSFPQVDYLCFTDQDFKSKTWKIIQCDRTFEDDNREAKQLKILPHKYLRAYDISIWVDGNFVIRKNPIQLIHEHMIENDLLVFDHKRNCTYDELRVLLELNEKKDITRDDPEIMKSQVSRYNDLGFPKNFGLTSGGVIIRRHNDQKIIELMSFWWNEITNGSKRDQLSFQFSCWSLGYQYKVMPYHISRSPWFKNLGQHKANYSLKLIKYRIQEILKLI